MNSRNVQNLIGPAPGALTDKNAFMKAFAFNTEVMKPKKKEFSSHKAQKSKGKQTYDEIKKKIIGSTKPSKKKSGRGKVTKEQLSKQA